MNDIIAANKRKWDRPPLTENEKTARLKQKEDERQDKKAKNLESTQERREKAKEAIISENFNNFSMLWNDIFML